MRTAVALHASFLLSGLLAAGHAAAVAPATAPTPAPAPVAAAEPADAAKPAPAAAVAVGDEIPFDALIDHVGATVRVTTNIGTVREGVVTGASPTAFNLKLGAEMNGITLGMPRERVVKVELVAARPARP